MSGVLIPVSGVLIAVSGVLIPMSGVLIPVSGVLMPVSGQVLGEWSLSGKRQVSLHCFHWTVPLLENNTTLNITKQHLTLHAGYNTASVILHIHMTLRTGGIM